MKEELYLDFGLNEAENLPDLLNKYVYRKAPPSRAVRRLQSLETVLPEIAHIFSDALIHFLQWILFALE